MYKAFTTTCYRFQVWHILIYHTSSLTHATRLLPLALLLVLRTRNNTDGNKLVIFSGIALYYGDNYILSPGLGAYERQSCLDDVWMLVQ